MTELILYSSGDGKIRRFFCVQDQSVWLSPLECVELFRTSGQDMSMHAKNTFEDGDLGPEVTAKEFLTVRAEAQRQIDYKRLYPIKHVDSNPRLVPNP